MSSRSTSETARVLARNRAAWVVRAFADPQLGEILHAFALLAMMDWAIRLIGLDRVWQRILRRRRSRRCRASSQEISRLVRAVRVAAANHWFPMNCLPRSLALAWLLAARGVATELRLGVARDRGTFEAHAWLELDGAPIGELPDSTRRFLPLHRRT